MPVSQNGVAKPGELLPIPFGRMSREAAPWVTAMIHHAESLGVHLQVVGPNSSFRVLSAQVYFWNHRPPPAAFPGTSNHGWGTADDWRLLQKVLWYLNKYAHLFGISHDEGARVGEAWHWRFVGGGSKAMLKKWGKPVDKLAGLSPKSRRLAESLIKARAAMRKEEASGRGPKWKFRLGQARRAKKRILTQMAKLRKDAYKDPKGHAHGWAVDKRGAQYQKLKKLYNGTL